MPHLSQGILPHDAFKLGSNEQHGERAEAGQQVLHEGEERAEGASAVEYCDTAGRTPFSDQIRSD